MAVPTTSRSSPCTMARLRLWIQPLPRGNHWTKAGRRKKTLPTRIRRGSAAWVPRAVRTARSFDERGKTNYAFPPSRDRYSPDVAVPRRGVSPLLFGLLLLAALAEGAGLFLFWTGKIQPKTPCAQAAAACRLDPTDNPLAYRTPPPTVLRNLRCGKARCT